MKLSAGYVLIELDPAVWVNASGTSRAMFVSLPGAEKLRDQLIELLGDGAETGTPIKNGEMSIRLLNALDRMGVTTWEAALAVDPMDVLRARNCGKVTRDEFVRLIEEWKSKVKE